MSANLVPDLTMGKRVNPAAVGAFVIGAVALVVVATTLLLGSGRPFRRRHIHVLFFESSVNGLRVGASVKFHGVDASQRSHRSQ
jgi:paraquat-inducible protein B